MEAFFDAHPDFGRTALFATVSTNCFRYEGEIVSCEDRLRWLADHGYEIANHTLWHENLHTVSDEMFKEQVGGNKLWIDERVPGRANLSNVLVLPFGEWPRNEQQVQWLKNTFEYEGEEIRILGIVEVSGGPSQSPSSGEWDRRHIARFNSDPATWEMWTRIMENGEISLYTSDGNPATVTIPDPIPADLVDVYDPDWASAYNMEVIRYELPGDADTADEGAMGTRRPAASSRRASPLVLTPANLDPATSAAGETGQPGARDG
jgi:peptidoglycan/xylan/chitin deacetylase (PgdA/CDA1 family)